MLALYVPFFLISFIVFQKNNNNKGKWKRRNHLAWILSYWLLRLVSLKDVNKIAYTWRISGTRILEII